MIAVLGIPFDGHSSFLKGPSQAPQKIREAFHSDSSNYFTESGINLKDHPDWKDFGDLKFDEQTDFFDLIKERVEKLTEKNEKIFALGGDHSISYPVVAGLSRTHHPLSILHIDAHADLYDDFDNNQFSHASPFARQT